MYKFYLEVIHSFEVKSVGKKIDLIAW